MVVNLSKRLQRRMTERKRTMVGKNRVEGREGREGGSIRGRKRWGKVGKEGGK